MAIARRLVVRILQVLVPYTELRAFSDRNPSDATWLPSPPNGSVGVVSIFVSKERIELSLSSGARLVDILRTPARTAWLFHEHNPIGAAMADRIESERTKLQSIPSAGTWPSGTRAVLWESRPDHDRHALELACDGQARGPVDPNPAVRKWQ